MSITAPERHRHSPTLQRSINNSIHTTTIDAKLGTADRHGNRRQRGRRDGRASSVVPGPPPDIGQPPHTQPSPGIVGATIGQFESKRHTTPTVGDLRDGRLRGRPGPLARTSSTAPTLLLGGPGKGQREAEAPCPARRRLDPKTPASEHSATPATLKCPNLARGDAWYRYPVGYRRYPIRSVSTAAVRRRCSSCSRVFF